MCGNVFPYEVARNLGATVSFMIIIHGQEMTFTNPVLQDTGVFGRQLILVLIFGTD